MKGYVTDENNNVIAGANLLVLGRERVPFKSHTYGAYFRLLMPGTYTIKVKKYMYNIPDFNCYT